MVQLHFIGGFGFLTARVIPVSFHFTSEDVLFGGTVCLMCSLIRLLVRMLNSEHKESRVSSDFFPQKRVSSDFGV
jgi:hypothetical protein